jgi:putative ATPase
MADLFDTASPSGASKDAGPRPLADRLRPRALSEVIGQAHILGPEGSLRVMLDAGSLPSLIFWGPPGVGKTTIARLLAAETELHFVQISAIFTGVPELRKVFEAARHRRGTAGHASVRRRDPPLQQGPAGRVPAAYGGRHDPAGRRHHREPLLRAQRRLLSRAQVLVLNASTRGSVERFSPSAPSRSLAAPCR